MSHVAAARSAVAIPATSITQRQPRTSTASRTGTPAESPPRAPHASARPRNHRKARRRHPVRCELEHRHECDADACADEQSSGADHYIGRCQREQQRAGSRKQRTYRKDPPRSPVVHQHARGNLDCDVGIEVQCRQVAQRRGRQREFRHELVRDHCGRDALEKPDQVKRSAESPHGQRGRDRWVSSGFFHRAPSETRSLAANRDYTRRVATAG